jgi:hypothetical protein
MLLRVVAALPLLLAVAAARPWIFPPITGLNRTRIECRSGFRNPERDTRPGAPLHSLDQVDVVRGSLVTR